MHGRDIATNNKNYTKLFKAQVADFCLEHFYDDMMLAQHCWELKIQDIHAIDKGSICFEVH